MDENKKVLRSTQMSTKAGSTSIKGSDEVFDFSCIPCSLENKNIEAAGFCKTCQEYLCDKCYTYHAKLTATKSHKLLNKATMPKKKLPTKVNDVLTDICQKHAGKVLEYFCNTHHTLCCSACVNTVHKSCSDTPYIPDISDTILSSSEYIHLKDELDQLATTATTQQRRMALKGTTNENYQSKALANINHVRKMMNEYIDQLEKDAKQRVSQLYGENSKKIQEASKTCQSLISEVATMDSNLKDRTTTGKTNQLFVLVKLFSQRASEIHSQQIPDIMSYDIVHFEFDPDEKLQKMRSTLSALWSLYEQYETTVTKASYHREICVKCGDDEKDCNISGISVLTGDRVVVTDFVNNVVKLFDTNRNTLLSRLTVSSAPFDIVETSRDHVAVALPIESKIELLAVTDTLLRIKVLQTPDANIVGLCYNGTVLIAACRDPGSIKMIDMTGKVVKTIDKNKNGHTLVTMPTCITISRDQTVIYVTDCKGSTVTTITTEGEIMSVYKRDNLQRPVGVTVGRYGGVYVCSRDTQTVHQLSSTGQYIRVLLGENQNLALHPWAIDHSGDSNMLYISSAVNKPEMKNYIRVFQLQ